MSNSVTIVAPEDVLSLIKEEVPAGDCFWSDSEPVDSPLNPLDDPLGGLTLDHICHIATIVFKTGAAGVTLASAVVKLVSLLKKPVQLRETKSNRILITVQLGTTSKEVEDALPK